MANSNPQAILFSNQQVRPVADRYIQLYWWAKDFLTTWTAQNMGVLIPNDSTVMGDGSDVDGRAPITGAMINGLRTNLLALTADLEATSNLKLNGLSQIAVNHR